MKKLLRLKAYGLLEVGELGNNCTEHNIFKTTKHNEPPGMTQLMLQQIGEVLWIEVSILVSSHSNNAEESIKNLEKGVHPYEKDIKVMLCI